MTNTCLNKLAPAVSWRSLRADDAEKRRERD
jgi:hypothetical protein